MAMRKNTEECTLMMRKRNISTNKIQGLGFGDANKRGKTHANDAKW